MKSKILLSAILFIFIFSGCKKYDENPQLITFRTVKSRLTNGDWKLQELITNGENKTDSFKEIDFNLSFTVTSDFGNRQYFTSLSYTYLGELVNASGNVYFLNDGDAMQLELYHNSSYSSDYPAFFEIDSNYEYPVWKISKLTNKELWMEAIVDGIKTTLKLSKN